MEADAAGAVLGFELGTQPGAVELRRASLSSRQRFMPQMSSVCCWASWWNGQLCSTVTPSASVSGSKPRVRSSSSTRVRLARRARAVDRALPPRLDGDAPPASRAASSIAGPIGMPSCCDRSAASASSVSRELVVAGREAHRDLGRRPPVDLGRTSRARAPAFVEPPVVDLEQALVGEPIEVVGGDAPLRGPTASAACSRLTQSRAPTTYS